MKSLLKVNCILMLFYYKKEEGNVLTLTKSDSGIYQAAIMIILRA